jgi:conjugal transfer/entry exclusion protein
LKFQEIVRQHQQELNILQNQFQNLLDMKDRELEEISYRMKTVHGRTLSESDEHDELKYRIHSLGEDSKITRDLSRLDLQEVRIIIYSMLLFF